MRAALSIALAGLLVTTPLKMVFAQAAQQEAATIQQTADSSGHRLIGVPPVTDTTSRLWGTPSDRSLLNTAFADALLVQEDTSWWDGLSTTAQVVIFIAVIAIVVVVVAVYFVECSKKCGG